MNQSQKGKTMFGIDNWMVAWTPAWMTEQADHPRWRGGQVRVGPWPDETGWSDAYACTAGCCNIPHWVALKFTEQKIDELIRGFFYLVLGQELDPQAVHREFSKIGYCPGSVIGSAYPEL